MIKIDLHTTKKIIATLTVVYIIAITLACLIKLSDNAKPSIDISRHGIDKVIHIFMYLILNGLLLANYVMRYNNTKLRPMILITLGALTFGVVIEIAQYFIGRECSIYDVLANTTGATTALLLFRLPIANSLLRIS